ncbi:MAG: IS1-like element transposase [Janthinobacterium lividum]
MVLAAVQCLACQQPEAIYRHGKTRDGRQRYQCVTCQRTSQFPYQQQVYEPGTRARILDIALNGSGIRDTARAMDIGPQKVMGKLKK